ncbi:MAG TPA: RNA methyltransferase [Bacteroidales bacterium]|nr:RNA methyltransferase [Bacteroidales bacterium]
MTRALVDHLSQFVSERRLQLFDTVLNMRTRYMTVVLEDIYQPHNASAVLRSCECFGIQDIHIIENKNEYHINPDVVMGSTKWLSINRYNQFDDNTANTLRDLKTKGYRLVATSPHKKSADLRDFDTTRGKFALLFGTELKGLSPLALDMADEFIRIPMTGFTESLNISVTAAICIHHLTSILHRDNSISWHLTDEEKQEIKLDWLRNSIRKSHLIEKAFLEQFQKNKKEF